MEFKPKFNKGGIAYECDECVVIEDVAFTPFGYLYLVRNQWLPESYLKTEVEYKEDENEN